jgi:hypothetical protein
MSTITLPRPATRAVHPVSSLAVFAAQVGPGAPVLVADPDDATWLTLAGLAPTRATLTGTPPSPGVVFAGVYAGRVLDGLDVDDAEAALAEMAHATAPGGRLVASVHPTEDTEGGWDAPTLAEVADAAGWSVLATELDGTLVTVKAVRA